MCVIIAKTKKGKLPNIDELENCFTNNPDGAGFMYTYKGRVIIDKGYMSLKQFIARYKDLIVRFDNFKNKSLIIHCRIGTSGSATKENTHPFVISAKTKELKKTINTANVGVVHNGIIKDYEPQNEQENISDTMLFIKKYLSPLYDNFDTFYKVKSLRDGIETITNSKWAIMDANDDVYFIGDFIKHDGVYYSNDSFIERTYNWYGYTPIYKRYIDDIKYKSVKDYDVDLKPGDYYEIAGELYQVNDRKMKYNTLTLELFKEDIYGDFIKVDDNVYCYDSDFELIM